MKLFERFWNIAGAVNLRIKVLGIVIGLVVVLGFFITIQLRLVLTSTLKHELHQQGDTIGEVTAEQASHLLGEGDFQTLDFLLRERQVHYSSAEHNTHVSYIVLEDADGQEIRRVTDNQPLDPNNVSEFAFPLPGNRGTLRLWLSQANIHETVNAVTTQIIEITLIMVGLSFAAAIFLTWILTRPILNLVQATQAVARGDFSQRVPRWANDEIGDLAEAFNAMTEALAQADHERAEREALRVHYIHGIIRAQEEERKRIARELHDSTSQSLTSLLVGLRNLEEASDPETSHQRIDDIRRTVNHTLQEVHTLAWQLPQCVR
jgi:HAMP domain-containing protein